MRAITLFYIEILLQVVFWIWFFYTTMYWARNNIHAHVDLIQSYSGRLNSIGNQLTVDSYRDRVQYSRLFCHRGLGIH